MFYIYIYTLIETKLNIKLKFSSYLPDSQLLKVHPWEVGDVLSLEMCVKMRCPLLMCLLFSRFLSWAMKLNCMKQKVELFLGYANSMENIFCFSKLQGFVN